MNELWSRRELPGYLAIGLLIVATVLAYANAWPDVLVHDDKYFVGAPHQAAWADLPSFFTEDLWAATGVESGLYRPLLLLSLALESGVHGDWLAGYHLDNILLHLLVTLTVYGFLRQVQRTSTGQGPSSDLYPLLAALVFAVHPVHTEVVNSIFNRSEMLVALAGAGGLWWFLHFLETRPGLSWCGLALCYLVALFSKESGIVLPAIAVALVLILAPGSWTGRMRKCLPAFCLLLPLALYLVLRAHALAHPGPEGVANASGAAHQAQPLAKNMAQTLAGILAQASTGTSAQASTGSLAQTSAETWNQISGMVGGTQLPTFRMLARTFGAWGQSLCLMVWPDPLLLYRDQPSRTQHWFYIVMQLALLVAAFLQFRAKRYGLLAGLVFFYIALLPSSRMTAIGGTPADLADRYLYFPTVGLAIVLASGFSYLGRRHGPWSAIMVALIALALLTPLTWNRNGDWANEVRLFESEYRRGGQGSQVLRLLTAAYLREGKHDQAAKICDTHPFAGESLRKYATHCAIAYHQLGRNKDAERAFLLAAQGRSGQPEMYANLAQFYLRMGRRQDAMRQFERAVETEDIPALRAYRSGEMLVSLYPKNRRKLLEARSHFIEALRLQPRLAEAQQRLDRLNRKLGPPP